MPESKSTLDLEGIVAFLSVPEHPGILTKPIGKTLGGKGVFASVGRGKYDVQKSIRGYVNFLLHQIHNPRVNATVLGERLGIDKRYISQMRTDGTLTHYSNQKYDLNKSIREYCNHIRKIGQQGGKSLSEERTRLTRAQADNEELKLEERKGELIEIKTALEVWGPIFTAFTSKIDAINPKMRPIIQNIQSEKDKEAALDELEQLLYQARYELSKLNAADYVGDKQDPGPSKAAAKNDDQRMGRPKKVPKQRVFKRTRKVAD